MKNIEKFNNSFYKKYIMYILNTGIEKYIL